ncbi:hypothetical protein Btru_074473 [Bulinus truncatus]|nr:hypothetical protein Btru_074473 [Bulinus truncatus]
MYTFFLTVLTVIAFGEAVVKSKINDGCGQLLQCTSLLNVNLYNVNELLDENITNLCIHNVEAKSCVTDKKGYCNDDDKIINVKTMIELVIYICSEKGKQGKTPSRSEYASTGYLTIIVFMSTARISKEFGRLTSRLGRIIINAKFRREISLGSFKKMIAPNVDAEYKSRC